MKSETTPENVSEPQVAVSSTDWLAVIKEEAAEMFREARAEPLTDMKDFDRALMSDFCRFVTLLANRVERRLTANNKVSDASDAFAAPLG